MAASNEAVLIREKLQGLTRQDYPRDKLAIIVEDYSQEQNWRLIGAPSVRFTEDVSRELAIAGWQTGLELAREKRILVELVALRGGKVGFNPFDETIASKHIANSVLLELFNSVRMEEPTGEMIVNENNQILQFLE